MTYFFKKSYKNTRTKKSGYPLGYPDFFVLELGLEPSKSQQSGGLLLPPVQKLVATLQFLSTGKELAPSPISRTATFGTQEAVKQKDVKMYDFAVRKVNPQPVTARADDIRPYAMTEGFQKIATSPISRTAAFGTQEAVKQKDVKMYDFAVMKANLQLDAARADNIRPYAMTGRVPKNCTESHLSHRNVRNTGSSQTEGR